MLPSPKRTSAPASSAVVETVHTRLRRSVYQIAITLYLIVATCSGLGILGKAQLISRILPVPPRVVFPVVLVCVMLPLGWQMALKARRVIGPVVLVGILCASAFIYPKMQNLQQKTRRGSDQADCVIVAAKGMAHGEWPYDTAKLWTHDPMSCGPGWVLMQTPAIVGVGYRWNLAAMWLIALGLLRYALPNDTVTSLLTLIGLSAVTWVTASDGTDFLPFGILLAALFAVLQRPSRLYPLALLLLLLVVQFRFPMLVLPILLLPYVRIRHGLLVSLGAFSFQLAFLFWNPEAYIAGGPLHLFYKLTHAHVLAISRWSAMLEVSGIFALMVLGSLLVRRFVQSPWAGFAYLLALTVIPAFLDLLHKRHEFGSLLAGLGIWEGANWMSGCLPLVALLLVLAHDNAVITADETVPVPVTVAATASV